MIINILSQYLQSSFKVSCISYVYILTGARAKKSTHGVIKEPSLGRHFWGNISDLCTFFNFGANECTETYESII